MAESYNPDHIWSPFGAFSMMILQGQGQVVHLKGQVSLDKSGQVVGPNDMRTQVQQVLENIQASLDSVGGRMSDVFSLNHFTTDIQAFMQTGDIRETFFSEPYPVTTTLEVAALYHPELVIEITASAEVPKDRYRAPEQAQSLHA